MRRLDTTTYASVSVAQPLKSGSLFHIQEGTKEAIASVVKAGMQTAYDPTKGYILYGLVRTGTGLVFNVTAGAIFFNDEVYQVDAFNFTAASGQTAIGQITTTYYLGNGDNADPVAFTDGTSHNVHEIRKIVFTGGIANTQDVNYVDLLNPYPANGPGVGEIKMYRIATADIPVQFDLSNGGIGIANNVKGWRIADGTAGTMNTKGKSPLGYDPGDTDFDEIGATYGAKTVSLTGAQNGPHTHTTLVPTLASNSDDGGTPDYVNAVAGNTGSSGSGDPHQNVHPVFVVLMIERYY